MAVTSTIGRTSVDDTSYAFYNSTNTVLNLTEASTYGGTATSIKARVKETIGTSNHYAVLFSSNGKYLGTTNATEVAVDTVYAWKTFTFSGDGPRIDIGATYYVGITKDDANSARLAGTLGGSPDGSVITRAYDATSDIVIGDLSSSGRYHSIYCKYNLASFGYETIFSEQGYVPKENDGWYFHVYSAVATESGPLSDIAYMYNYNGTTERGASVQMQIWNTAGTTQLKRYYFETTEGQGPAWRLASIAWDSVGEPAVVKGTRYRIVFTGGRTAFDNSAYEMRYRYDEVGSTNNHYGFKEDLEDGYPSEFDGAYTDIRRLSFYAALTSIEPEGPPILVEGITPGSIEGVDWGNVGDVS